jgi:hypothetical protein
MVLLVGLIVLFATAFFVVGGGWARTATISQSRTEWLFSGVTIGLAASLVTCAVVIGLELQMAIALPALGGYGALGWYLTFRQHPRYVLNRMKWRSLCAAITVMVVAGSMSASTYLSRDLSFQQRLLVGPDTIGNAVAVNALARGETLTSIGSDLVSQIGAKDTNEALDPRSKVLYSVPSIQTQIESEFLVAGLRWGLSGLAAIPVILLGETQVWLVLASLSVLSLCLTAIGVYIFIKKRTYGVMPATAFGVLTGVNVTLLHSLREGGNAQIVVLPLLVALLNLSSHKDESNTWTVRSQRSFVISMLLAAMFVTYSDLSILLVACGVVGLALYLSGAPGFRQSKPLNWVRDGSLALLLVFPFSLRFITYLPRRLVDSTTGGWSMRVWPGFAEALGLVNSYSQNGPTGIQQRSPLQGAIVMAIELSVILLVTMSVKNKGHGMALLALALVPILLVRFKAQVIDQVSNYQYFKAWGCLLPIIVAGLGILLGSPSGWLSRIGKPFRLLVFGLITSLSLVAGTSHSSFFVAHASTLPTEYVTGSDNSPVKKLDDVDFVAPLSLKTMALAPLTSGNWFGRGYFGKSEKFASQKSRSLSVLIDETQCPNWACLRDVEARRIRTISRTFKLVRLGPTRSILTQPNTSAFRWSDVVSARLQEIGGPQLDSSFNVTGENQGS